MGGLMENNYRPKENPFNGGFIRGIHFIVFFLWGLISSFALVSSNPNLFQSIAMIPPFIFWMLVSPGKFFERTLFSRVGQLVCLAGIAAVISMLVNQSDPMGLIRYLAPVPALIILLLSSEREPTSQDSLNAFLASGFIFCLFHLFYVDRSRIFDPHYRIEVFLNTNGVGFISMMTALGLLVARSQGQTRLSRLLPMLLVPLPLIIMFLSRSRTASGSFLAGLFIFIWIEFRHRKISKRLATIFILSTMISIFFWKDIFSKISEYYSLFDEYRNISNATNRTEIWKFMLTEIISKNPIFGVGPGAHEKMVESAIGYSSAHNGMLLYLGEVGIIGTLPYILLLELSRRYSGNFDNLLYAPLLVGGLVESLGETMFISVGSVGSLLFLLSIVHAARRQYDG
jgi:O-antigen ligase